ncbi:involucrin repeat protein [Drechmeria coniospora]|uniref:Involucrin repeat protein n=1 Tax=Drechmeria coniospora TaxID=98403 RepID=A0A151GFC2_DRECN|nr:involucrin repeat protein [Drechmeria coniospora]KYK55784.1 involucrin repeat protein [Drechmeria coniospora]
MNGYGASKLPRRSSSGTDSKITLDGYRRDAPNLFDKATPQYALANPNLGQKSGVVDLKDPIQIHLLTETALSDSKGFEVLTQEDVDELKKESQLLLQRVESTKKNLAIQSKYRDAAVSMFKLSRPGDANSIEAEKEMASCERKCEGLAAELFNLEKRLMIPQRRLLEHTAGVLQLTHKASRKKGQGLDGQPIQGIPGSPESLYTYTQSRNSLEQASDENYADDPSLYQLESLDGVQARAQARKNPIEIPMKSPIREQNQLRGEVDRVREENMQLRGQTDMLIKKLQGLNTHLRETIVKFNPEVNKAYLDPPAVTAAQDDRLAELLKSQVEYLESGLVAVQAEQDSFAGGREVGERIYSLNLQLRDLLMHSDPHYTPEPIPPENEMQRQFGYLEDSLRLAGSRLGGPSKGDGAETGPVLTDLWNSIQNGFKETKRRKDERRRTRGDKGASDEDDMSEDEAFNTTESYSISSFATRVQWLQSQASTLKDQKYVLKRQIKQQRELNNKSDAEKDVELDRLREETDQCRQRLAKAESESTEAQTMLSKARQDLERSRGAASATESMQTQLQDRDAKINTLETKLRDAQSSLAAAESQSGGSGEKLTKLETEITGLRRQKTAAEENARNLGKELGEKTVKLEASAKAIKGKEDEMDLLKMTLAELKTEATIAKAELDGAYGTRAERAADVAAVKNGGDIVKLQNQVERLKKELGETVGELEGITKETIGAEREKLDLETKLDEALMAKAALEVDVGKSSERVAKLQEELDSMRLKASPGGVRGAGASMLSEQFRATMREERKKFQEDLREERTKCRRLEDELSRLKRGQGPGKSPLSPR